MPVISVGMRGIDFAFAPDTYPGIAKAGAGFVSRYSAGVGGISNDKCVKAGEIAAAQAAGVDFLANFELSGSTPDEGALSGTHHGSADALFWNDRGLAPHAGVCISDEPGNDPSKFPAVAAFISAYKAAVGRPVGLYAGLAELLYMRKLGIIDMTWLPMSSAASGYNWGNITQAQYAANMLKVAQDNGLNLVQNRNRWYGNGADEDIVVNLPKLPWSHMQALAYKPPVPPKPPVKPAKLYQGAAWPGPTLKFGSQDFFANVNGPANWHGGANGVERPYIQMIQRRLMICGFVPGHTNAADTWADGWFDTLGNGSLTGPTTDAVVRFQKACMPGTKFYGEVWADDWKRLFNL